MAIAGKVAITPKGEWDSAVTYEKLDAVTYNNALYMAKKPSVGQVPTDGEYWMFCLQSIDYAEFEKIINGTTTVGIADKANKDKNGDDIVDTYAKKADLTNFQNKDGDSKDNTVAFESSDEETADAWTDVAVLATGEKHSSLFAKISTMFKNIRYIYTHFIKSENILDTLEEIVANTQSGKVAGALAVKELNSNLDGKIIYKDYVTQTNSNGYVGNSSWLVNKVIKFSILSPKRYACEEFINEIGEPYYYIYVHGRGENPSPLVSQDVTVRVFFAENTKNI